MDRTEKDEGIVVLISRLNHSGALWNAWLEAHGITDEDLQSLDPGAFTKEVGRAVRGSIATFRLSREAYLKLLFKLPP